jgi:hypothetical protein
MTTRFVPDRVGMPPPRHIAPSPTMSETLRLMSEGDGKYRLENSAGAVIGWIRGQVIGLTGFASVADAMAIVPMLNQRLETLLSQHPARRLPTGVQYDALHLVHDGAYEWITAGARPIARVYRPGIAGMPSDAVSIEFVLPASVTETAIIRAALAIVEERKGPRQS